MSRSKKKKPFGWICKCRPGIMKDWKAMCNRKLRRIKEEIPNGTIYRRLTDDRDWNSPSDGKTDLSDWHKAYRK